MPTNDGACSKCQREKVSIQENVQFIPTTETSSSSNNPFNKIVILEDLEDPKSRSIQTDPDQHTCESRSAQKALHLSADTPSKRKLSVELGEVKRHKKHDFYSVNNDNF